MAGDDGTATLDLEAPPSATGERLDRFLAGAMADRGDPVSRATIQGWIREGAVTVNGAAVKPRHALVAGDGILVRIPEEVSGEILPEEIALSILHEDEDIVVVDKPSGLVVHPGSGNPGGTLVNALLHHTGGQLSRLADEDRPGIVHRLDKDTSGCLVAAKSDRAYRSLVEQFSGRETEKEYLAVVAGVPDSPEGTIRNRIGRHPVNRQRMAVVEEPAGKEAITDYRVLRSDKEGRWAALSCVIHTGRTHQIRVHLKECVRCPILGDVIYGQPSRQKVKVDRLLLHARRLGFTHPASGVRVVFEAPVPPEFGPFLEAPGDE